MTSEPETATAKEQIGAIRVITVTNKGKEKAFCVLGDKLANLSPNGFVALDTEFSGLGKDPEAKHDNLQTRYTALRRLAHSRAIFSVGISIFNPVDAVGDVSMDRAVADVSQYEVSTFDLLLNCQSPYGLDPDAGSFLVAHGFDFNRMFCAGIPYIRASESPPPPGAPTELSWQWGSLPRGLLWRIGRHAVPVVVHNGLFDLVFLYAALQAALPATLNEFVGALLECVPAGFWDSKVLATDATERTSFLSYLFAKSVLNSKVAVRNAKRLPSSLVTDPPNIVVTPVADSLCALYAFRGFCPRGTACPFAHDAFKVVVEEQNGNAAADYREASKRHREQSKIWKRQKVPKQDGVHLSKKQRKLEAEVHNESNNENQQVAQSIGTDGTSNAPVITIVDERSKKAHTAGWDAFCTGYVFASFRAKLSPELLEKDHNRIALPSKLSNLLLQKSEYANLDEDNAS